MKSMILACLIEVTCVRSARDWDTTVAQGEGVTEVLTLPADTDYYSDSSIDPVDKDVQL